MPVPTPSSNRIRNDRKWAVEALRQVLDGPDNAFRVPGLDGLMQHLPGKSLHVMPELFVQLAGVNRIDFPSERIALSAGQACLIPRGLPHGETFLLSGGRFQMLVFMFEPDRIDFHRGFSLDGRCALEEAHGVVHAPEAERLVGMLDDLALMGQRLDTWSAGVSRGLKQTVLCWLGGLLSRSHAPVPVENPKVYRTLRLITHQLEDPGLNTRVIAAQVGCSPAYLSALFHRETGETLVRHIHQERLRKARYLLSHSEMSIKEVAVTCGFGSADYFGRLFRRSTGMTPRQFREGQAQKKRGS